MELQGRLVRRWQTRNCMAGGKKVRVQCGNERVCDARMRTPDHDPAQLLEFAHELADAAGVAIMPFFRTANDLVNKASGKGFDPVTAGDRAAETVIRNALAKKFPNVAKLPGIVKAALERAMAPRMRSSPAAWRGRWSVGGAGCDGWEDALKERRGFSGTSRQKLGVRWRCGLRGHLFSRSMRGGSEVHTVPRERSSADCRD